MGRVSNVNQIVMNHVVISLGSNKGNRKAFLLQALDLLKVQINELATSKIYETKAVGMEEGHEFDFLNMVCKGKTRLNPQALLEFILDIEKQLGRERKESENYLSRTIDLDILFYNDDIVQTDNLIIPHPRISERVFVLKPLNDILPHYLIPGTVNTISDSLVNLDSDSIKIFIESE